MFPSMQLGGEKEMIEQAQVGALAIARISVGPMGPVVPEMNVFNLPLMFRDTRTWRRLSMGRSATTCSRSYQSAANLIGSRLDECRHP